MSRLSQFGEASVPFTTEANPNQPFADLDKSSKVDDFSMMLEQWSRPMIIPGEGGVEAAVGVFDVREAGLLSILAKLSRAVCKISVPAGPYTNFQNQAASGSWSGTGFLVGPNLLLTNHHVLNSHAVAAAAVAEFEYQFTETDITDGPPDTAPPAVRFKLKPDRLFITSPMNGLDFTFVWIENAAASKHGTIPMKRGSFPIQQGQPTYIIHHPEGVPKKVSLDDTEVRSINASFIHYEADTLGGSSGSPVFNRRGNLVALHHAWRRADVIGYKQLGPNQQRFSGGVTNTLNEGIKLSAIAIELERRVAEGAMDARAAETVLAHIGGSDTLTGLFGSLGRHNSNGQEAAKESAYEHVVSVYQSSDQDVDVGAWNIEWLNRDYTQPGKLERVAQIITDINLDIWALSEVSRDAIEALLKTLQQKYNQKFEAGYSEPDSGSGKQATAVIWRPNVVKGERVEWPEDIHKLFKLHSRDDLPFEAVHGKIFNRYPGLFRFSFAATNKPFDFFLVPLHLKAKGEGSLRRRLASKVLSHAVEQMIDKHGSDEDWVLLGDLNAPLASNDFDNLTDAGFTPLSATDEDAGAITYLKAPYYSLIDNIFLSSNMSKHVDADDFFIIARDKVIGGFVDDTSDHRPIAMRLSLRDAPAPGGDGRPEQPVLHDEVDTAFAALLDAAGIAPSRSTRANRRAKGINHVISRRGHSERSREQIWKTEGLTKPKFLRSNSTLISSLIEGEKHRLKQKYRGRFIPLTEADVTVIFMVEAGIGADGMVDPSFIHSNGEFGLFPLPNNISDWVGNDAPAYNQAMSIDVNVRYYLRYLGELKNKRVKTLQNKSLYRDLFDDTKSAAAEQRNARLLAGVVHGYFWKGNYAGQVVPLTHLMEGYDADQPVDEIMAGTSYVHAGKSLLVNRQANIDAALQLL